MEATREAVDRARAGDGPTLIECKNLRLKGHAAHDPADYIPPDLLRRWKKRDPISLFRERLKNSGILDENKLAKLQGRIEAETDEGVEWAEASPWPEAATLEEDVFSDA